MRRTALTVLVVVMLALAGGAVAPTSAGATGKDFFPKVISLPNGFQPEGISTGRGTSFYVGSVANGAIYRGSVRTGAGAILVPGRTGRVAGGRRSTGATGSSWPAGRPVSVASTTRARAPNGSRTALPQAPRSSTTWW